jgi:hypothetical protein
LSYLHCGNAECAALRHLPLFGFRSFASESQASGILESGTVQRDFNRPACVTSSVVRQGIQFFWISPDFVGTRITVLFAFCATSVSNNVFCHSEVPYFRGTGIMEYNIIF